MQVVETPGGGVLAILCDGMGGLEGGQLAAQTAITAFRDYFLVRGSLFEAGGVANAAVAALRRNTGTTLIAAHVTPGQFEWISIGDSPLYLLREGSLQQVNKPHVYANLLTAEEAEVHPERDSLTSYVGIPALIEIDQSPVPVPLRAGDRVILASDGLSRALQPADIVQTMKPDAQASCNALVAEVLSQKRPGQDNVSVITVSVDAQEPAVSPKNIGNGWGLIAALFLTLPAAGLTWHAMIGGSRPERRGAAARESSKLSTANPPQALTADEPRAGTKD